MTERSHSSVRFLTFDLLEAHEGFSAVVTTRHGGASKGPFATLNLGRRSGDDPDAVSENRRRAASLVASTPERLTYGKQVHGTNVAVVQAGNRGCAFDDTDALVTAEPDTPLVILTADCAAVVLFDPVRNAVGVAHAGWRGTVAGIVTATVERMREAFGSDPSGLLAAIGPSIGPCCYEVGAEVMEAVGAAFPAHRNELLLEADMASAGSFRASANEDRLHFDLWRANEILLLEAGVREANIEPAGLCTACRTDIFYSHRAEHGNTGRFGALVSLHGTTRRVY